MQRTPRRMSALTITTALALVSWRDAPAAGSRAVPTSLEGLEVLAGEWAVPDSVIARQPRLRDHVVHAYRWAVGRNAFELRESYTRGRPDSAQLTGVVYLDPATQRIEFVAVAGPGANEGRLFRGEYRILDDGAVERTYDVFYRTLADTPGEELGGLRRRYREIYRRTSPDSFEASLDWWLDGRWKPFGPGRYAFVRVKPLSTSSP